MTEWEDQAIILRLGCFHEADLWLRILSRQHGLQTVFAFGGAKSIRRFCGCLDIFNTLVCKVKSSRSGFYLNLQEASLLSAPAKLRHDWRRMGMAANCIRFLELVAINPEESEEIFLFLESFRNLLESPFLIPQLLPVYFRLGLISIGGFIPPLDACCQCGKEIADASAFLLEEGKLLCPACKSQYSDSGCILNLSSTVLDILRQVQKKKPENWPRENLASHNRAVCATLINKFVEYHLGIKMGDHGFEKNQGFSRAV